MKYTSSKEYTIDEIEELINSVLQGENINNNVYDSIDSILLCIETIIAEKGDSGWSSHIIDNSGNRLISDENQEDFETKMEPIIPLIISLFDNTSLPKNQIGGDSETETTNLGGIDIDTAFQMIIDKLAIMDETIRKFASESPFGILHFVNTYDQVGDDPEPFGIIGNIPITTPFIGPPAAIISKIKIPARIIVTVLYSLLDIVRIIMSTKLAHIPKIRKVLSIFVSIVDLLKGDWKGAVLSFAGFYGENPLMFGVLAKLCLQTFYLINPQIRESFFYGIKKTSVSLIVGFLLKVFQTLAPWQIRNMLMSSLESIRQTVIAPSEEAIELQGLPPISEESIPTFEDIQSIQSFISDPVRMCSAEFQSAIEPLKQSALLRIVLQLLNIPTNEITRQRICGRFGESPQPYIDNLAKDRVDAERKEKIDAPVMTTTNSIKESAQRVPVSEPGPEPVPKNKTEGGQHTRRKHNLRNTMNVI